MIRADTALTEKEIVFAIAKRMDFDENFSSGPKDDAEPDGEQVYWDAECSSIPNYVKILGKPGAVLFLNLLDAVANAVYREEHWGEEDITDPKTGLNQYGDDGSGFGS